MINIPDLDLQFFAEKNNLQGLTIPSLQAVFSAQPDYAINKAHDFLSFQQRINHELLSHRIINSNHYTAWFKKGELSEKQLQAFIIQFSVFSNQFLIAQLQLIKGAML